MTCTYPSDGILSNLSTDCIDTLIKERIDFYTTNNNGFPGVGITDVNLITTGATYKTQITNIVTQLQQMVGSNPATSLQEAIQADTDLDVDIIQAKEDMKIAEERVKSLRQKDKTSYYESWFPLNRPLRTSTNITLIALGIFFYVFVFLVILSSIGFSFNLNTTWLPDSPTLGKLGRIFPFGYGTILIVVVLIGATIAGYLRKA